MLITDNYSSVDNCFYVFVSFSALNYSWTKNSENTNACYCRFVDIFLPLLHSLDNQYTASSHVGLNFASILLDEMITGDQNLADQIAQCWMWNVTIVKKNLAAF